LSIGRNKDEMIDGVIVQELKQIADERGKVMHMLKCDSPLFEKFGEIYFSVVNPGVVKAWKRHKRMTQNLAVPTGMIKLALYDNRDGTASYGRTEVLEIGEDNYCIVKIPPVVWYGFQCISSTSALIANCSDIPHYPDEAEQKDPLNSFIPYQW
jgi:dTDP-4-dehydrorhamnose 3,5-epimerase